MTTIRPRDAATLIVLRRDRDSPRVLMGQRSDAHAFMPGTVVFPGGRVDRGDRHGPADDDLHPAIVEKLCCAVSRPTAARARALALAAIRETYEETGVLVGRKTERAPSIRRGAWTAFLQAGVVPSLAPLRLVARAITPPKYNRRFDARFFAVFDDSVAGQVKVATDELEGPAWLTFDEARERRLPEITRMVLDHLEERLRADPELDPNGPVPFFLIRRGRRCIEQL